MNLLGVNYTVWTQPSASEPFTARCQVYQITGSLIADSLLSLVVHRYYIDMGPETTIEVRNGNTVFWRLGPPGP